MFVKIPIILVALLILASVDSQRLERSLQPGAPNVNNKGQNQPWQLDPHIQRDDKGNVRTDVNIQRHGDNHDFDAGWSKVVRGPNKAKPTWHVGGTYRWRRSLQPGAPNINNKDQPWQLDPHIQRDARGNVKTDVNIQRHGDNNDFEAGWSKVIRGPNKAKPTWHIGGTHRWRRSIQPGTPNINNKDQPWQLDPHIQRDDKGNVKTDVNIQRHGDNNDFEVGWSKVVRGPNKAKPTWHVGGTYRWRRSIYPDAPSTYTEENNRQSHIIDDDDVNVNEEDTDFEVEDIHRLRRSPRENSDEDNDEKPWQLDPNLARDNDGNTKADVNIKRHGEDHDFEAGWSKVLDGPNRAKPTWHVGGSFRW